MQWIIRTIIYSNFHRQKTDIFFNANQSSVTENVFLLKKNYVDDRSAIQNGTQSSCFSLFFLKQFSYKKIDIEEHDWLIHKKMHLHHKKFSFKYPNEAFEDNH